MKHLIFRHAERLLDVRDGVFEVLNIGLIRADILRGHDTIEFDAELFVAACKRGTVNVRQNAELIIALQVAKRGRAVRKGRPTADRLTERSRFVRACLDAPQRSKAPQHFFQDLGVERLRRLGLTDGFDRTERFQDCVVGQLFAGLPVHPRPQLRENPAFPVDKRAVAIEG